jgi:hypothetical protein
MKRKAITSYNKEEEGKSNGIWNNFEAVAEELGLPENPVCGILNFRSH